MLDIAANRIKKIENISHLTELQEFWVSTGQSCSPKCHSEGNPSDGQHMDLCALEGALLVLVISFRVLTVCIECVVVLPKRRAEREREELKNFFAEW